MYQIRKIKDYKDTKHFLLEYNNKKHIDTKFKHKIKIILALDYKDKRVKIQKTKYKTFIQVKGYKSNFIIVLFYTLEI